MILSLQKNYVSPSSTPSLFVRIFDSINKKYDSAIDFFFKWTY